MQIPENVELVNGEICRDCGGECCKHCGCSYSIDNFKILSLKELKEKLEEGKTSIVSQFVINRKNVSYYLQIRARNLDRDVIDLFSIKNTCASLTPNGCSFKEEERPQAGLLFIPKENNQCYGYYTNETAYKEWINYQKVLERLVRQYTNKSSLEKIKEDIITAAYTITYNHSKIKNGKIIFNPNNLSRAEQEVFDTLNSITPTFQIEVEKGMLLAKTKILEMK